jgi:hypothetical protein
MTTPFTSIDSTTLSTISGGTDWISVGEAGFKGMRRGAFAGAAGGALAGSMIGSVAAGVGAVPGAVLGAGAGAVGGMIYGMDSAMAGEYLRQRADARGTTRR